MTILLGMLLLAPPEAGGKEFPAELTVAGRSATVRLLNAGQGLEGSGVIIRRSPPFVYVLTAGHLVDKADTVELVEYTAQSYPRPARVIRGAEVVARSAAAVDLALVRYASRDQGGVARLAGPNVQLPEQSFPVLLVGCPAGKEPVASVDRAQARKLVKKNGDAAWAWEVGQPPEKGKSGGPLLDRQGLVLGICSGQGDGKGYYIHIDEIRRFLKHNGFQWLYETQ